MSDSTDTRFFEALKKACDQTQTLDTALREAVEKACATGEPLDRLAARQAVDELDTAERDRLLRHVHLQMATDLSAIWDALPAAPDQQRPN